MLGGAAVSEEIFPGRMTNMSQPGLVHPTFKNQTKYNNKQNVVMQYTVKCFYILMTLWFYSMKIFL